MAAGDWLISNHGCGRTGLTSLSRAPLSPSPRWWSLYRWKSWPKSAIQLLSALQARTPRATDSS